MKTIDIVFDGPPGHTAGRFVEVENENGASIHFGEWVKRDDGYWVLRIPNSAALLKENERLHDLHLERTKSTHKALTERSITIESMQARIKGLEKVVEAAEPINDLGMDAAGYEWDELDAALAALKEQT